jgi:FkbM family methyltransferase
MPDMLAHCDILSPEGELKFRVRPCRHGAMVFLPYDTAIGRALELYGEFAECENRLMSALVRPGDVVVDVGANVGTVALALARAVGPQGTLHLFEPQPILQQALHTTLTINGLTTARLYGVAVGNSAGQVKIPVVRPEEPGNYGAVRVTEASGGIAVPLITLDSLMLPHCRLIKIDVEGMDFDVLLGAADLIARTRPFIYMEAKEGPATSGAIGWLQSRGYGCYWHFATFFSPDNFRGVRDNVFGNVGDINLLALPAESGLQANLPLIREATSSWQADYEAFFKQQPSGRATS